VPWRASGPGVAPSPFLVDGWACGYVAGAETRSVEISLPTLVLAAQVGFVASVLVTVPVALLALFGGPRLRRFLRRTPTPRDPAGDG
ncbi:MAG TPA: hypothetical protein VJQ43_03585, partial [Thermoplasmata archaeon]|nr:hypothetical protein [Thermoplasmata archaeon]